jgi:hypothetical protein
VTLEEGLELVEQILAPKQLNKVQKIVICGVWQDCSYKEIQKNPGYTLGHIKDTGADLWKLLSEATGEKVTRYNFQGVWKWVALRSDRQWSRDRSLFSACQLLNFNPSLN